MEPIFRIQSGVDEQSYYLKQKSCKLTHDGETIMEGHICDNIWELSIFNDILGPSICIARVFVGESIIDTKKNINI